MINIQSHEVEAAKMVPEDSLGPLFAYNQIYEMLYSVAP